MEYNTAKIRMTKWLHVFPLFCIMFLICIPTYSQKVVSDTKDGNQRCIVTDFAIFGKYIENSGPIGVALECHSSENRPTEYYLQLRYKYLFPQTISKGSQLKMNLKANKLTLSLFADKDVTREDLEKIIQEDVAIPTANGTWYLGTACYSITEEDISQIINNLVESMVFSDETIAISSQFTYGLEKCYKNILKRLKKQ